MVTGDIMTTYQKSNGIEHIKKRAYLTAYARLGVIRQSCVAAEIAHSTYYEWLKNDPVFGDAVENAREVCIETLEQEADRRAVAGIRRYKFYQGKPILHPETGKPYYEHIYSDVLLIFLLKALKPEMYREGYQQSDEEINRDIEAAIASLKAKWERERASANGREN